MTGPASESSARLVAEKITSVPSTCSSDHSAAREGAGSARVKATSAIFDVAAGTYRLTLVHPTRGTVVKDAEVRAGERVRLETALGP